MRDHWHKGRGFVKAHVAVDVETLEVLAVVATDDHVSNCRAFKELIEQVLERGIVVCRVLTNGACNTGGRSIFFVSKTSRQVSGTSGPLDEV